MSPRRKGYEIDPTRVDSGAAAHFATFADPMEACRGADLVTTDVWTSMGFEAENDDCGCATSRN